MIVKSTNTEDDVFEILKHGKCCQCTENIGTENSCPASRPEVICNCCDVCWKFCRLIAGFTPGSYND